MKEVKDLDIESITRSDTKKENIETVSMDVTELSPDLAYLEFQEDLTDKTISYIEREVRNSYEYRQYIKYLKDELDLTKCSLMPGIDASETNVSLEFHHYPMNLFEIVSAVGSAMIDNLGENEKVSCFDISEKVVAEHYLNDIGLVPLTVTMHKMAHNRSIIIPISKVNGNYKNFMVKYNKYIPEEIKERVADIELTSDSDDAKLYNQSKLEKKIMNYDITYFKEDKQDE